MTSIRDDRIALFANLQSPATQPQYWARVADNVDWTVAGTHPLAGTAHRIPAAVPRAVRQKESVP